MGATPASGAIGAALAAALASTVVMIARMIVAFNVILHSLKLVATLFETKAGSRLRSDCGIG